MDFELSEEQLMIQRTIREFGKSEIAPTEAQYDRENRFPIEIYRKLGKLGMLGGVLPPEYGGTGMDYMTFTIMLEELGYFTLIIPALVGFMNTAAGRALVLYGTEDQKKKFLPALCRGEIIATFAVTEPQGGTDVSTMTTRCHRDGDHYVINGSKTWISFVPFADFIVTFARSTQIDSPKNYCAFIVDRNTPGLRFNVLSDKLSERAGEASEIFFDACRVPKENLIGKEGEGLRIALGGLDENRLCFAARSVGALRWCLDECVRYTQERVVFGKPIGTYQLIQSKITEMATNVECGKALIYKLAWLKDRQNMTRLTKESSMTKLFATNALMKGALEAVQIFGAYGCTNDNRVARLFRDAKMMQIAEGTNEIHTVLIAEYILGYRTK